MSIRGFHGSVLLFEKQGLRPFQQYMTTHTEKSHKYVMRNNAQQGMVLKGRGAPLLGVRHISRIYGSHFGSGT